MIGEMKIATAAERPELLVPAWERTCDTLPEYNNHGDVLNEYWPRLTEAAGLSFDPLSVTVTRSSLVRARSASDGRYGRGPAGGD